MPEYVVTRIQTWHVTMPDFLSYDQVQARVENSMSDYPDTDEWQVEEIKGDDA